MLLPILAPHFMAVLVSRQTKGGKIRNDLKYILMKKKVFVENHQVAKIDLCKSFMIQMHKTITKEF